MSIQEKIDFAFELYGDMKQDSLCFKNIAEPYF